MNLIWTTYPNPPFARGPRRTAQWAASAGEKAWYVIQRCDGGKTKPPLKYQVIFAPLGLGDPVNIVMALFGTRRLAAAKALAELFASTKPAVAA